MKAKGWFDWRKGAMCLMSVVALCAFTGMASNLLNPYSPLDPFDPFVPPAPQRSDLTKYSDGTEPIMFFLQQFMAGDSRLKFEVYNDRIRNDDEDYEAYICRGLTWLTSLSEDKDVMILVNKFGFMVNDEYGTINFSPISSFDFGSGLQYNRDIDAACEKAVPVLKAALADFEKVPKNWSGSVDFQEGFDVPVCFDYADSLVARSVVSEMLSFLYLMKGYNTVAADGTTKPIDLEALAEARRWMKTAAEFVNAFVIAQDARTDYFKDYFFNLNVIEAMVLRENARNLVDVSDWTVQFDLVSLSPFFFLTGDCLSDETKKSRRKAKREKINRVGTLDVTLRNVFEGKLSADDGTFPSLFRGAPLLDASVPDPTFAGTFPGISRTVLAELLSAMADEEVSKNVESIPGEEIAHYGVFYKLPEGAENNPGNPATFSADLESPITLLNPSMAGYCFSGWSPSGEIRIETAETLEFKASFDPIPPEGAEGNPWMIGATADDAVVAWTNGTGALVIEGTGAMKDFTVWDRVPWGRKNGIALVTVGSGVTSLGDEAFADCPTGEDAEIVFKNSAAVINVRAFVGYDGTTTNVPAVTVETVVTDGQGHRVVPIGFRDVEDKRKVYPTLQAAIDAGASEVTPKIRTGVIILFLQGDARKYRFRRLEHPVAGRYVNLRPKAAGTSSMKSLREGMT